MAREPYKLVSCQRDWVSAKDASLFPISCLDWIPKQLHYGQHVSGRPDGSNIKQEREYQLSRAELQMSNAEDRQLSSSP